MRTVEQMRNVAQDLITSYDARVDAIGTIMDNTYQVLDDFKDKRAKLSAELKDTLAKRGSLRKKDFDRMMNGILLSQEEKEKEVKQSLKNFIKEQKKEAFELKDALRKGEVQRMKKAQTGIEKGIVEVKGLLKGFYEQQKGLTEKLRELLTKRKDLKIKDFKDVIRNLSQDAEFAQTLTRGKEVKKMGLSDMATDIKALGQDMAASHVDRAASIETLKKETKAMMETFQEENIQRGNEVIEMLSNFQKENAQRQEEVNKLLEGFRNENTQRQEEVRNLLKEVPKFMKGVQSEIAQQRVEVSNLMDHFHKENAQRQKEVNKLMKGFQKENEQRQAEVSALLHDFRKEHDQLAAAVKEMWSTVARAKGGAKTVSAHSLVQTEEKKPASRKKGKSKKVESL